MRDRKGKFCCVAMLGLSIGLPNGANAAPRTARRHVWQRRQGDNRLRRNQRRWRGRSLFNRTARIVACGRSDDIQPVKRRFRCRPVHVGWPARFHLRCGRKSRHGLFRWRRRRHCGRPSTGRENPCRGAPPPLHDSIPEGGSGYGFAVVRYLSNGQLDATFGIGGKVTTMMAPSPYPANNLRPILGCGDLAQLSMITAIALQPDGRVGGGRLGVYITTSTSELRSRTTSPGPCGTTRTARWTRRCWRILVIAPVLWDSHRQPQRNRRGGRTRRGGLRQQRAGAAGWPSHSRRHDAITFNRVRATSRIRSSFDTNPTALPDATFGDSSQCDDAKCRTCQGVVTIDTHPVYGWIDAIAALALQPDGKVTSVGRTLWTGYGGSIDWAPHRSR